jgi:hypothetical protein
VSEGFLPWQQCDELALRFCQASLIVGSHGRNASRSASTRLLGRLDAGGKVPCGERGARDEVPGGRAARRQVELTPGRDHADRCPEVDGISWKTEPTR